MEGNKQLKLNDCSINYIDVGEGAVPIIFIHGFPFDKSSWQPQIDFIITTNRVIAYDIRGFGLSTSGSEKISISLFADDLIEFMDILGIRKAILCGLSMGGYIVLNAVSRFPDRFEAIVLCDTQCIADSPAVKQKRNQTISQIMSGKIKEFADNFVKNVFTTESLETKTDLVENVKKMILNTSAMVITRTLKALVLRNETCTSLKKISMPVLIICGKEDTLTPVAQSEYLHSEIQNSEMMILQNASHLSNLEQVDEFNNCLVDFISRHLR